MNIKKTLAAAALAAPLAFAAAPSHATPVGLELSLVIDVSGSISTDEYNSQRSGYAAAFNSAGVKAQIASITGGVAVNVIQFGSDAAQAIGWTLLTDDASVDAFVAAINAMVRIESGLTDIIDGLTLARSGLNSNTFVGARRVIDVSGDGRQNVGTCTASTTQCQPLKDVRDLIAGDGITINGLAILTEVGDLDTYYTDNLKTASGFVLTATAANFAQAVETKIGREITGEVPAPATLVLFGAALLGLAGLRRKA